MLEDKKIRNMMLRECRRIKRPTMIKFCGKLDVLFRTSILLNKIEKIIINAFSFSFDISSFQKMFKKSIFQFLLCTLMIFSNFSVSTKRWIFNLGSPLQEITTKDFNEKSDNNNFSQQWYGNNSNNTIQTNVLFWKRSDLNSTLETDQHLQMDTKISPVQDAETSSSNNENSYSTLNTYNEETFINQTSSSFALMTDGMNKENKNHDNLFNMSDAFDSAVDEKIVLHRKNCNLEIPIQENQDLKIKIEFEKLENTSGKCSISLNGQMNSMLGILISNIRLHHNDANEVIQVIIRDYGSDFILKEYYSWSKYQPLLLTETHRVYIVLLYEVKSIPLNAENSHFNLEVFNYKKYDNSIHNGNGHYQSNFSSSNDLKAEQFF